MSLLSCLVLLGLLSVAWSVAGDGTFMGGTISYSVRNDGSGHVVADLDVLTGWTIHKGHCGNQCTNSTRVFGSWILENEKEKNSSDITRQVNSKSTEGLLRLDPSTIWEQKRMQVSVDLEAACTSTDCDIYFDGHGLHPLSMQPHISSWRLRINNIYRGLRNDTGVPNRSPITLVRPVYRMQLNKINEIQIASTDPDNDSVTCRESIFTQDIGNLSKYSLPGLTVHRNCTITLDTNSTQYGYKDDSWGAVALDVGDHSTKPITIGTHEIPPFSYYSVSTSPVQFLVQVVENLDAPVFVSPTAPASHHFILYPGTTWRQKVYAKSGANTTISEFRVVGREQEAFVVSSIRDGDEPNVKTVEIQWHPTLSDTRNHIFCITAVDDTGVESSDDRCFMVGLRNERFTDSMNATKNAPNFVDLPAQGHNIHCDVDVTCVIPLYIKSDLDIERVHIARTNFSASETGPVSEISRNGRDLYKSDLTFQDTLGYNTICLIAIDVQGRQSAEVCFHSQPDPCSSYPCMNSATCSRNPKDSANYICHCRNSYHGKNCEIRGERCQPNPCNGGTCYTIPPYNFFCLCGTEYVDQGSYTTCYIGSGHCLPDSCHSHGVCKNVTKGHTCKCDDRYSGFDCSVDKCPHESPLHTTCDPCLLNPCSNGGTCSRSTDNSDGYICHCQAYTRGKRCEIREGGACDPSPCHTGVCYAIPPNDFFCQCVNGFYGKTCSYAPGHCLSDSCHSHGVCENGTANYHNCRCFSRYSGPDCQVDKCPQASPLENTCACDNYPCQNGGTCREDGKAPNKFVCKCQNGFSGTDCSIETPISESHFDRQTAQPLEVECGLGTSCLIPVNYHGPDDKRPIAGYADQDLQGIEMVTTYRNLSGYNTNETSTMEVLSLRYAAIGKHRLCLHTTDNGQTTGKVNDQLCLTVQVSTKGPNHTPINHARPYFSFSTLPSGTKLSCEKGNYCHLWVTTERASNGNCNSVINCQASIDDIRIAPPVKYSTTCITDVYAKLTTDSGKLCLSAGQGGEQRTFEIVAATSSGSIIDVSHSSAVLGRTKPYFLETPEVRKPIVCRKGSTCKMSVQVMSKRRLTSVDITHYGQANATIGQPKFLSWNGTYLYNVTLTVKLTIGGLHHVCMIAKDTNNHTSDETCIQTELLYSDPCSPTPCLNSGTCVRDLKNPESHVCLCAKDLYSGRNCETVHSPCQPDPCVHGRCSVVNGYANCQCDAGYAGEQCDHKAFNCHVDRCIHGVCQNFIFSSHCVCDPGYDGQQCEAWSG